MNTFLKILLCVLAVLIALKFLPFLVGGLVAAGLIVLITATLLVGGVGIGVLALCVTALLAAALLSPLWIPVLAVVGVIALIRHCTTAKA